MVLTSKVGMTGTSGLLGKHVVQYFLEKNYKIIGLEEIRSSQKNKQ